MKMKRLISSILAVFMLVSMIPANVFAVGEGSAYGTVESISEGITYSGNIRTGNMVEATFAGTLQKSVAPIPEGEAWWVGVKMIAPEGYDPEKACYTIGGETKSFEANKDGDNYIELWGRVTPEYLQTAADTDGLSTYVWVFDWDGDGADLQTFTLNVDAYNTVLKDGTETAYFYPYGTAAKISDGVVFSKGGAEVEGTYSGTLQWIEGNDVRQDGWWVGIKLTAPKEYDAEKASYIYGGNTKLFKDYKDGEDYIELWGWVMPEFLESACQTDGLSTHTWEFNWDGEGEAEQTINLNIDPYKTVLKKGEETVYAYESGAVQSISDGITYKDGVQSGAVVEATYGGTLEMSTAPIPDGEAWWVGVKLTAPEHYNAEAATCTINGNTKSFKDNKDGDNYIELWGKVTPAYLAAACQDDGLCTYTWEFNWDGVGEAEQKVVLNVDASKTKLMQNGVQRYPSDLGAVNCYTGSDVEITGNGTGEVNVTINKASLTWSPANAAIGRSAGWWVGIGVTVPEELKAENSEEVLKKIKYQVKNGPNAEWGEEKSFYANRDSATAPHYMQLWFPVNPISLQKFKDEGRLMTMWYRFDWDGETGYDQTVTFSLNPQGEIELDMTGTLPTIEPGQAYVDASGNTKVFFEAASVHGIESATVNGVAAALEGGKYVATLNDAETSVTIEVKDIYGNVVKEENVAVQPKLTVSLSASEAAFSQGTTYYFNDEKKLSFDIAIDGEAEDGVYAIDTTVLTAGGQPLDSAVVAEEGVLSGLKVVVTDNTGRTAEATLDGTYIYDKTAPVVSVEAEGENVIGFFTKDGKDFVILQNPVILKRDTTETVSFKVTVTDANLNPELYKTAEGWTITGTTATKTFGVSVEDYADGKIDLQFTAVDMSGNKGAAAIVVLPGKDGIATPLVESVEGVYQKTIYVDRRTPGTNEIGVPEMNLEINKESAEGVYFEDFEVSIALTDNGAGIKNVTYNLEDAGGAVAQIASAPELRDGKYVIPVAIKDGCESDRVWLTVIATDNVGNSFTFHKNFSVDKRTPVIELVEGAVNGDTVAYYDGDATFLFSVGEMFGYELDWKLDDTVGGDFLALTTDKEYAYVTIKDGAVNEVVATLTLTATDVCGHESEVYSISFVVDNKAPEVTVSTDADSFVQNENGVDYFSSDVNYNIVVSDKFMEDGHYTLEAEVTYEDGTETVVLNKTAGGDLTDKEVFTGEFAVTDGRVLKNIRINVLDAVSRNPDEIATVSEDAPLTFAETEGIWSKSSNHVVVDMTAPEVIVEIKDDSSFVQTVNGVDYFAQEVTYNITVSDQFMEKDTYTLEAFVKYEDEEEETRVELRRAEEESETIGAMDEFAGSFTVVDGKVLTDIRINVLDAAKRSPDEIVTVSNAAPLTFAESEGIWSKSSNHVVVDMTAPEVTVSTYADSFVQTVNGVDYFKGEVIYTIEVADKFMEGDSYILEAAAIYEDGEETPVLLNRTSGADGLIGTEDAFSGFFTVVNGKVLKDIRINVLDAAKRNPDEIATVSEKAPLSFAETGDIWNKSSNYVVVDETAPEVTVATEGKDYVQTFEDVDYFAQEVTYSITVTDQFMEEGTYTLEAFVKYEDEKEETRVELSRVEEEPEGEPEEEQKPIGAEDKFEGFFTVVDGKVLTGIRINVLDAAKRNPDEVKTIVMLDTADEQASILTFEENGTSWERTSNNICVDTTAPTVEISFSENVVNFYHRDEGENRKYFALVEPVKGTSEEEKTGETTVEMTVTIKDVNITMDETSREHYEVKSLIADENAQWNMTTDEFGQTVLVYSTSITVQDDRTANLPFDLQIYDLASNCPAEVTLVGENPEADYTLPDFAAPEKNNDGIVTVGDTIIIDRRRSTSENNIIPELTLVLPTDSTFVGKIPETDIPLYNGDMTVELSVKDEDGKDEDGDGKLDDSTGNSAGIQAISWVIDGEKDDNSKAKLNALSGEKTYGKDGNGNATLSDEYQIPVSAAGEFESNDITLEVTVTDNAGNKVTKKVVFALDNLAPRVNVTYNSPAGNSPYFREIRTATIEVTDINFNLNATEIFVKPGVGYPVNWEKTDDTHTCEVRYAEDGDYEFSMSTTDLAKNISATSKDATVGKVEISNHDDAPHTFTIDMTKPVIDVLYNPDQYVDKDGNGVEYFDEERTVEVIITDANFAPETTTITGNSQTWKRPYRGMENHYGTVFGEGNNYAVNVTSIDKAGNVAEPVNGVPFSVDLTAPTIDITTGEMTNGALNIVQDDLVLGFTINDVNSNLKSCEVVMQHVNGNFETVTVSGEAYYTERNAGDRTTRYVDITNIAKEKANDGIYIVQINVTDYAEHTVSLTPELYMSLNRFGSSFIITDAATKAFLTGKEGEAIYRNEVKQNLIIQEINPNEVWQDETENQKGSLITLAFNGNANELVPDVNYSVIEEKMGGGSSTWYLYTYEIFTDNFYSNGQLVDGRYKLLFYSEDAAGNKNANETNTDSHLTQYESGATAGTAEFILDHQTPVVSVIGITQGQEIRQDNQIVEIGISDNAATFVMAYIDGKEITLREYSADLPLDQNWFAYNAETGKYMLNIAKKNSRQDVKFVVTDAAGNETVYEVGNVLVTRNILVQYVNSVPALCITAVLVIAAVAIILILKKKKKKETE